MLSSLRSLACLIYKPNFWGQQVWCISRKINALCCEMGHSFRHVYKPVTDELRCKCTLEIVKNLRRICSKRASVWLLSDRRIGTASIIMQDLAKLFFQLYLGNRHILESIYFDGRVGKSKVNDYVKSIIAYHHHHSNLNYFWVESSCKRESRLLRRWQANF